jgi:hypothetical protein
MYPVKVCFPDAASLLGFLGRVEEEARFRADLSSVLDVFPHCAGGRRDIRTGS